MSKKGKRIEYASPYDLDGIVPFHKGFPLGLQHAMSMFIGNLLPILVVTAMCGIATGSELQIALLQNAVLVAGLVTMVQIYPIGPVGSRLPIFMGTSASFIGIFISVVNNVGGGVYAYGALLGASLIGGLIEGGLGFALKPLKKFFPNVVIGTVVFAIGLSLMDAGINSFGGGADSADFGSLENVLLATSVLIVILVFKHGTKGVTSYSSVLFGIIFGFIAAALMGIFLPTTFSYTDPTTGAVAEVTKSWVLDWNKVAEADWFSLPKLLPVPVKFNIGAIVPIAIMFIITTIITMGTVSAVTQGGLGRKATNRELSGGVIADGVGTSFAVLFSVLPNTSYATTPGLIAMTKAVNRYSIALGAGFLCICSFVPKLMAIFSIMPQSVLGGVSAMLFASLIVNGIQIISQAKFTARVFTIISVSIGVGYALGTNSSIMAALPNVVSLIFGGSGVIPASLICIVLNILLPKDAEDKKVEQAEAEEDAALEAMDRKN